ncbi:MAG: holo-ACP synthase [Egibacteraceae bacterium]
MPKPPPAEGEQASPTIRVGIDIVSIGRVERLLSEQPAVTQRVFTDRELEGLGGRRRVQRLAGRFAAKEAVLKAFGTGLGPRMNWTDVEITSEPGGRPRVRLGGAVAAAARRGGLASVDVSVAHTGDLAVAHAIAVYPR